MFTPHSHSLAMPGLKLILNAEKWYFYVCNFKYLVPVTGSGGGGDQTLDLEIYSLQMKTLEECTTTKQLWGKAPFQRDFFFKWF